MSIDFAADVPQKPNPNSASMAALPSVLRAMRGQKVGVALEKSQRGPKLHRVDRVEISATGRSLADVQRITEKALKGLILKPVVDPEALLESGGADGVEQVESDSSSLVDRTANQILRGITGYIFAAFASQHPDMTEENLDEFLSEASKGVDLGFGQTRNYLVGMDQFGDTIKSNAEASIAKVYEGLRAFVEEQREVLLQEFESQ